MKNTVCRLLASENNFKKNAEVAANELVSITSVISKSLYNSLIRCVGESDLYFSFNAAIWALDNWTFFIFGVVSNIITGNAIGNRDANYYFVLKKKRVWEIFRKSIKKNYSFSFFGIGPRKWMINPFRKFLRIWSPHSIYFGWSSFRKNAPNSLFDILKSTSSRIFTISSSRSFKATRSFLNISLFVICRFFYL